MSGVLSTFSISAFHRSPSIRPMGISCPSKTSWVSAAELTRLASAKQARHWPYAPASQLPQSRPGRKPSRRGRRRSAAAPRPLRITPRCGRIPSSTSRLGSGDSVRSVMRPSASADRGRLPRGVEAGTDCPCGRCVPAGPISRSRREWTIELKSLEHNDPWYVKELR